ncbi:MAG TPA: MFS transporter [Anaerolineae bacterium]|nr:MFS transporter [Anaerolineae bacterium]
MMKQEEETESTLWRNRNFNIFWFGQTLSSLGDAFALIAVPLLVLEATGSVAQMGLVTATFSVGWLLSGILAGAIVDKVDRRRLMIWCDVGRFLSFGAIPLGWTLWGPSMPLIYIATLIGSMLGMTFLAANSAAVPNLVEADEVVEANGRFQLTWAMSFVVGPVIAGFVSDWAGPLGAIWVNALSFLVSAVSIYFIKLRIPKPVVTDEKESVIDNMLAGVRYIWSQPVLKDFTITMFFVVMVLLSANDLFIYFLKTELGQDDSGVGLFFGISTLGAVIAGTYGPRIRKKWGFGISFLGAVVVEGIVMMMMGVMPTFVLTIFLGVLFQFAQRVRVVVMVSIRQELTPNHLLGRVTAAFLTLAAVPGPIGVAIATGLAEHVGVRPVMVGVGMCAIVIAAIGTRTRANVAWPELGFKGA